ARANAHLKNGLAVVPRKLRHRMDVALDVVPEPLDLLEPLAGVRRQVADDGAIGAAGFLFPVLADVFVGRHDAQRSLIQHAVAVSRGSASCAGATSAVRARAPWPLRQGPREDWHRPRASGVPTRGPRLSLPGSAIRFVRPRSPRRSDRGPRPRSARP